MSLPDRNESEWDRADNIRIGISASSGFQLAQMKLAALAYKSKDYKEAFKWTLMVAAIGNIAPYQVSVAISFQTGVGTEIDFEKSFYYANRAADQGSIQALSLLGGYYEKGEGCEINLSKSFEYNQRGAVAGNASACMKLGVCYMKGSGVEADRHQGFHWLKVSAEKGSVQGMRFLADCYRSGDGCNIDLALADEWDQKAGPGKSKVRIRDF
jgi:TPR repeat protein